MLIGKNIGSGLQAEKIVLLENKVGVQALRKRTWGGKEMCGVFFFVIIFRRPEENKCEVFFFVFTSFDVSRAILCPGCAGLKK